MYKRVVCSVALLSALTLPVLAENGQDYLDLSNDSLTGSFWDSNDSNAPLQFFSESELKINGLVDSKATAPKSQDKTKSNDSKKSPKIATKAIASLPTANKYNMPPIYVNTTGVVYKKVPDHRRRSLASRGAHSVQSNIVAYKTIAVREPIKLNITPIICKYSEKYKLDPWLIRAIIEVESNFNPDAGSYAGAGGLMQLMHSTALSLGCKNRFDPESNIAAGTRYLRQMCDLYPRNMALALAAYNAGPGNVSRYGGIPPFTETRNYVKKVTRLWRERKAQHAKK